MGTIEQKLAYLLETKQAIKQAIEQKGVEIREDDTFREYANKINMIGGGSDMPVIGDGKTYLYIKIAERGRMEVPLYFSQTVADGVTIDWGDGSATQTLSGTGEVNTSHTYADVGEYTISLNPSSGCTLGLGRNSSSAYSIFGSTVNNGRVYCNMLQAVEIGKNVTSISNSAFRYCSSLASVVIPDGITSIGNNAFNYCHSLANVVIPDSVTSIGVGIFQMCCSLANIVIPQGITSIGNNAFYNCHSLANVVIPDSVTNIGDSAFHQCYSLSSVVIPDSVTRIGDSAFNFCYSLASVVIPDGVTNISANAFNSCYSLSSVVIPDSVTNIDSYAFRYGYGMAFYDFRAATSVPTLSNTNAFQSIPSDCKIVVPDALYDEWIEATNWSSYASYIIKKSDWEASQS